MRKKIFYLILGGVLFTTVGVIAESIINSSQVIYTKSDSSEISVETALNELFTQSSTKISSLQNDIDDLQDQIDAASGSSNVDCVKKVETDTDTPTEYDINGEKFIVIWSNQYETALISKYNVSTSTRKQVESDAGKLTCSNNYWYDTTNKALKADYTANGASFSGNPYPYVYNSQSKLYTYLNDYKTNLNSTKVKLVRLATYEELVNLGCKSKSTCPSWIKNTSFWTGSVANADAVWLLNNNGSLSPGIGFINSFGVRPVIVVSTSKL